MMPFWKRKKSDDEADEFVKKLGRLKDRCLGALRRKDADSNY